MNTDTAKVQDKVKDILSGIFNKGIAKGDEHRPLREIGLDSIGMIDFIISLEAEFGISLADDDVTPEVFASVNSVTAFVAQKEVIQ